MKSDNYIQTWILIAVSTSHQTLGANPAELYYQKPDYIDIDFSGFIKIIEYLQSKELVNKSKLLGGNICITKKGEKELDRKINELKTKKEEEYISLISSVPIYELKERISTLEKLLFYSIMGGLFLVIAITPATSRIENYARLFSIVITILFFIAVSLHFTTLILFVRKGLKERIMERLWHLIDKYYKILFYLIFILLLTGGSYALNKYFGFEWRIIIGTIVLDIIATIILNSKKIQTMILEWKEKSKKRYAE